jgi:hypothetical protein
LFDCWESQASWLQNISYTNSSFVPVIWFILNDIRPWYGRVRSYRVQGTVRSDFPHPRHLTFDTIDIAWKWSFSCGTYYFILVDFFWLRYVSVQKISGFGACRFRFLYSLVCRCFNEKRPRHHFRFDNRGFLQLKDPLREVSIFLPYGCLSIDPLSSSAMTGSSPHLVWAVV